MDSYLLQPYEEPCSVMTTSFKPKDLSSSSTTMTTSLTAPPPSLDKYYFVVGTALALPSEDEPTKGRILVFSVTENKLRLEAETTVRGAVYCICDFILVGDMMKSVSLLSYSPVESVIRVRFLFGVV
jgi:DNA damage-binding protein 1